MGGREEGRRKNCIHIFPARDVTVWSWGALLSVRSYQKAVGCAWNNITERTVASDSVATRFLYTRSPQAALSFSSLHSSTPLSYLVRHISENCSTA